MKLNRIYLGMMALLVALTGRAATHYVNAANTSPVSPYLTWATAATNIQDAINVATGSGEPVLVTNGIYRYGTFNNAGLNRVSLQNILVQSVNGPAVTIIEGSNTNSGGVPVRCVYMTSGMLSGFTLTNGATAAASQGGGVRCASAACVVSNCIITGNSAMSVGGGAYSGTLINCVVSGNYTPNNGGGTAFSAMINCIIMNNVSGYYGAGVANGNLVNCTLINNSATNSPGGAMAYTTAKNCIAYYNYPDNGGQATYSSTMVNCCTIPLPISGSGTITNPPLFAYLAAGDLHLSPASPCINAGLNSAVTTSGDFDGNPRIVGAAVDIGAYEFQALVHYVNLGNLTPLTPFTNWVTAATNIQDAIDVSSAGDFVVVSNGLYKIGGRAVYSTATNRVTIDRAVTVQSVNGPAVTAIAGLNYELGPIRCVYLTNGAAISGFTLTNGVAASSTNIIVTQSGGGVWCESTQAMITNCVLLANYAHQYGGAAYQGTLNNCVISSNVAFINGGGTYGANLMNCLITSNRTVQGFGGGGAAYGALSNCVITWNYAAGNGGGAWCSTLNSCVVSNNTAGMGGGVASGLAINSLICSNVTRLSGSGGGAYTNILYNCVLKNNYSTKAGGGAYNSTLVNCTVVSNTSAQGGGIQGGSATNCIIYFNTAPSYTNFIFTAMNYCDTLPLPTAGFGNFTNDPAWVNVAAGDLHLQSNSPCINSGNNVYVMGTTDIGGNPRIVGGTVDMGAYEFQAPTSIISYAYLQRYGLPTDGSADFIDADGDGFNTWQARRADTNPLDASSLLQITGFTPATSTNGPTITWQSVAGVQYSVVRLTHLFPPDTVVLQNNVLGQLGYTSYTDVTATNGGPYFYRVGVQ